MVGFWDHPRVCGEKAAIKIASARQEGSPPRMRGKEADLYVRDLHRRITPAYAGKSICKARAYCWEADHPRVCGEKQVRLQQDLTELGSPPRMRGKAMQKAPRRS